MVTVRSPKSSRWILSIAVIAVGFAACIDLPVWGEGTSSAHKPAAPAAHGPVAPPAPAAARAAPAAAGGHGSATAAPTAQASAVPTEKAAAAEAIGTPPSKPAPKAVTPAAEIKGMKPADALKLLQEGNRRFISGKTLRPNGDPARRADVASGQEPFAIVVGCADSRTSPELMFDRGLGDLFVTRDAGNVLDDHTLGSIEYAVSHLHSRLIVVLGHERCGAVKAAREVIASKGHAEGHVHSLVEAIRPAVDATSGMDAEATCRENIRLVVKQLRDSDPILKGMVDRKEIQVVGAYYDLDTGYAMFMPE